MTRLVVRFDGGRAVATWCGAVFVNHVLWPDVNLWICVLGGLAVGLLCGCELEEVDD